MTHPQTTIDILNNRSEQKNSENSLATAAPVANNPILLSLGRT
ncbi:hypothetical protein RMSM_02310 [Rhodopirellula maiorica SM1]|uniref:Uncharacterized protein n=1 Tax=Rhodopirellula maiorica SM1 TaxID=1265738 RepID=M5S3K9_9BACT|nr:hypothetical protein RMSM_02310 [Rhodopirellula maiorica SM1]